MRLAEATVPNDAVTGAGADASAPSYRYPLALLTTIYVFNFVDRQVVNIVAEPIKREFGLADWQLGSLTGLAFAVLYTLAGFPIARLAERGDRARIIGAAVIAWSGFTALCGLAGSFVQLLAARIGVGLGEAGCTPAAHSLIADIVPREKRASALAIYTMGAPIGGVIGLVGGGFIAAQWGWRAVFFVAAAPGVVLMLLALFTLPEPRRGLQVAAAPSPPFRETVGLLLRKRSFVLLATGGSAASFFYYGLNAFFPSFILRNHAAALESHAATLGIGPPALLGLILGVGGGVGGVAGAVMGGRLGDAWAKRDAGGNAALAALGASLSVPVLIAGLLAPSLWLSAGLIALGAAIYAGWVGSFYAATLGLVPPQSRATASALMLFIINLVGIGLGPLCVGLLSDRLALRLGDADGLRWAMVAIATVGIIAGVTFRAARAPLRRDTVG